MTPEQHAQRIRQLELQLHKADCGLAMPRDYQRVAELRTMLETARKEAELESEKLRADKRLRDAAPDLLKALKQLSAGLHDEIDSNPRIKASEVRAARAAIAKAEGSQ